MWLVSFLKYPALNNATAYTSIDHESQDILYAIKGQNAPVNSLPHLLVVHVPTFNRRSQLIDEFWIGDGDFQIGTLLIALEPEQILPHHHLHRVDDRLVLGQLSLQVCLETIRICLCK